MKYQVTKFFITSHGPENLHNKTLQVARTKLDQYQSSQQITKITWCPSSSCTIGEHVEDRLVTLIQRSLLIVEVYNMKVAVTKGQNIWIVLANDTKMVLEISIFYMNILRGRLWLVCINQVFSYIFLIHLNFVDTVDSFKVFSMFTHEGLT
jgi:hypothetical protein